MPSYYREKLMLCLLHLSGAGCAHLGAILTTGDVRWFCVTLCVSIITATFLALMFHHPDETIQLVVSRCGFTLLGGVFLTKYIAHVLEIKVIQTDIVAFGGLTCVVSIVTFIVGFKALRYLERRSEFIARKFIDAKTALIFPPQPSDATGKDATDETDARL